MLTSTESLVIADIQSRQQLGIIKYGSTVAQNPLELVQWLNHAYEEALDQAIYLKRAIQELKKDTSPSDIDYIHANEVANLFGGNGLSTNRSITLVAQKLAQWRACSYPVEDLSLTNPS